MVTFFTLQCKVNEMLVVFLTGSSSVGKTTLTRWLKKHVKGSAVLSADEVYEKEFQRLFVQHGGTYADFLKTDWRKEATKEWHKALVDRGRTSVVWVDTVIKHLESDTSYLRNHGVRFKVVVVGTDLAHLLYNVLSRNFYTKCPGFKGNVSRSASAVLSEVAECWNVSSTSTDVVFDVSHLRYFDLLLEVLPKHSWVVTGLKRVQKQFEKKYFTKKKTQVCVKPSVDCDLVLLHHKTKVAGETLLKYLEQP